MARGRHYRRSSRIANSSLGLVIAIVVGAGIGVGVWAVIPGGHHPADTHAATGPAVTSTTRPRPAGTSAPPAPTEPTSSSSRPSTTAASPSTSANPTSVPSPVVGSDSVTYTLPAGTPVKVTAVNRCWVQVRASASAPVTEETILAAGQVITVPSPLWIRLGDPSSATATVGATNLQLPSLAGQLVVVSPGTGQ